MELQRLNCCFREDSGVAMEENVKDKETSTQLQEDQYAKPMHTEVSESLYVNINVN